MTPPRSREELEELVPLLEDDEVLTDLPPDWKILRRSMITTQSATNLQPTSSSEGQLAVQVAEFPSGQGRD